MMASNIYGSGSTYMVAMPSLFKIYVVWIYIEIDKTNKLGIQAKVQFQDVGVAQLFVMPRPLEKNPVHRGSVLMYTNIQFHT